MKMFLKKQIKKYLTKLDFLLVVLCRNNRFTANLYYFFKPSFWRENWSVLQGRYQYHLNLRNKKGNLYLLRRNIHRLEKGILMRPRKDVFAESYIEETVNNYILLINSKVESSSLRWAHDVLVNYFDVVNVSKSSTIERSRDKFLNVIEKNNKNCNLIPYKRNPANFPMLDLGDFKQLAKYRRSVRWYLDKEIEREKIDEAIEIARYSPSACNRQPYKFMIYENKEKVKEIAKSAMGTTGYSENIPVIVAVVGDLSAYFSERDRHIIYIDSSLATMSFIYGLEVQGISSCIINWPDIEDRERRISKILNLKPFERVIMLIAIGYADPDGMVAYSQKKGLEEIRTYD